jgi:hypothetical protein
MGIFADFAPQYAARGLRVFPVGRENGKIPLIKGWPKVRTTTVNELARKFPDANIGVVDGDLITRVDIDDLNLIDLALDRFGETPIHVRTPSGGLHYWYAANGEVRKIRLDGLGIDILGKGGFGVAPPSIRPDGRDYHFAEGGLEDIASLPKIKASALSNSDEQDLQVSGSGDDSSDIIGRNDILFKKLLRLANSCETKYELGFLAGPLNDILFEIPMGEDEVQKIVGSVWKYKETDDVWVGKEPRAVITKTELDELGGNGDAALVLIKLRTAHGLRNHGEFVLANAIAGSFGWGLRRFRAAKAFLVKCRFIEITHQGGGGLHDPPKARLLR